MNSGQYGGVADDVLCAGNEKVYTLLDDVLTEVAETFPSEYIHIGGDECPKDRWKACDKMPGQNKGATTHSTATTSPAGANNAGGFRVIDAGRQTPGFSPNCFWKQREKYELLLKPTM